tara:strand:- start:440 stop:667 length:228 start_codon:yes stop_codon:yes gene_type:complete
MSYYSYGRLKFCYQLLAFFAFIGTIVSAIIAITNGSTLYGCAAAVCILVCAGCVKRSEKYQTKMDNWSYKHYLDK